MAQQQPGSGEGKPADYVDYDIEAMVVRQQFAFITAVAGIFVILTYGVYYQYLLTILFIVFTMIYVVRSEDEIVRRGERAAGEAKGYVAGKTRGQADIVEKF